MVTRKRVNHTLKCGCGMEFQVVYEEIDERGGSAGTIEQSISSAEFWTHLRDCKGMQEQSDQASEA